MLELMEGYYFREPPYFTWVGEFLEDKVLWGAPSLEIGLELFYYAKDNIIQDEFDYE